MVSPHFSSSSLSPWDPPTHTHTTTSCLCDFQSCKSFPFSRIVSLSFCVWLFAPHYIFSPCSPSWIFLLFLLLFYYIYLFILCVHVRMCMGMLVPWCVYGWSPEGNLWKSVLCFHPVGSRDQTQVVCLGGKLLYLSSHFAGPKPLLSLGPWELLSGLPASLCTLGQPCSQ